jgi:hypothetical protein
MYSLGLRLKETTNLHVADIDSERMFVHIHHDRGAKDRYYGFFHPKKRRLFDRIRLLLYAKLSISHNNEAKKDYGMLYPDCGSPMPCLTSKNGGRPPPLNLLLELFAA